MRGFYLPTKLEEHEIKISCACPVEVEQGALLKLVSFPETCSSSTDPLCLDLGPGNEAMLK